MWISGFFNGNTAYPHVDRLCVNTKKLCTYLTVKKHESLPKPSTVHAALLLAVAAGHQSEVV
jgi:hypothetical protein